MINLIIYDFKTFTKIGEINRRTSCQHMLVDFFHTEYIFLFLPRTDNHLCQINSHVRENHDEICSYVPVLSSIDCRIVPT